MIQGEMMMEQQSSEDINIPDEFSEGELDDIGYEVESEKFLPRDSVSSRGGASRKGTERYIPASKPQINEPRAIEATPNHIKEPEYHSRVDQSYGNEKSESVISEIVDERIVYLESDIDREEVNTHKLEVHPGDEDRSKQIEEYLDIEQDDYINRDEYQNESETDGQQDLPDLSEGQQRDYDDLEKRKQELLARKRECEMQIDELNNELDTAFPIDQHPSAALEKLDYGSISEMKSYNNPSSVVEQIGIGVMICLGGEPTWAEFRKLAQNRKKFTSALENYDARSMDEDVLENLDDHIETHDLSNIPQIRKVSNGAAGLAQWLISVSHAGHINQNLRPQFENRDNLQYELEQIIEEIERIEEAQAQILQSKEVPELRMAGLQTIYDDGHHYLHFESVGEDGEAQTLTQEYKADFYPELQFENQNEVSQNEISQNEISEREIGQESLFYISNEIKKKDQSKKFVLWETNELRNQWEDGPNVRGNVAKKSNINQWEYDGKDNLKSVVDTIDHKKRTKNLPTVVQDYNELKVPKKDHYINNVFLQSALQDRFSQRKQKQSAPLSHSTFNKNDKSTQEVVGRPIFSGSSHTQNISNGRARTFYSSNIF